MTGNEYQKAALRTENTENQTQNSLLINGVLGLCGESGEVADLVKKARFQGHPEGFDRERSVHRPEYEGGIRA